MKFTKEEISLCKQIYRKYGEILDTKWKPSNLSWEELAKKVKDAREMQFWSLEDCLEFLRERGFRFILHHYDVKEYHLGYGRDDTGQWSDIVPCKTPLEACLKAVLAVLEESK